MKSFKKKQNENFPVMKSDIVIERLNALRL